MFARKTRPRSRNQGAKRSRSPARTSKTLCAAACWPRTRSFTSLGRS